MGIAGAGNGYSQYYAGTEDIYNSYVNGKTAYVNGEKVEKERDDDLMLPVRQAKYDFSKDHKSRSVSREEWKEIMGTVQEQHGDGVSVSISGLSMDWFQDEIAKWRNRPPEEQRELETKALTDEMREELYKLDKVYGDDNKNILNHSFINDGFRHSEDFAKAASGYAKYLNHDLETGYDGETFFNLHDEQLYKKEVTMQMKEFAANILSYFRMGEETEEERDKLSGQLADAVIEYAKNMANGDRSVNHVTTKLDIGGTQMTYGELQDIQETLQRINGAGVKSVYGGDYLNYEYSGMASNYDTGVYAQLGLRTAQVNYFSEKELSGGAGSLVKEVWQKRFQGTLQEKLIKPMIDAAKLANKAFRDHIKQNGNYAGADSSFYKLWKDGKGYEGSEMQQVYDIFAGIKGDSKLEFMEQFDKAMKGYNAFREREIAKLGGYYGTEEEKKQLDYLEETKYIL